MSSLPDINAISFPGVAADDWNRDFKASLSPGPKPNFELGIAKLEEEMRVNRLGIDEVITECSAAKDQGNALFKAADFEGALKKYTRGLSLLDSSTHRPGFQSSTNSNAAGHSSILLTLQLNCSACCLKMSLWQQAVVYAAEALKGDPNNVKALYRRGVGHLHSGQLKVRQ
jgi:hypothetical protein